MRLRLTVSGVTVGVDGGRLAEPGGRFDLNIALAQGELRPGLINAHDHLHRNHFGRLGVPPYPDAYAWGRDLHARCAREIARARQVPRRDALLFGALKNLLGGATTVMHHDPWEPDFDDGFPIRVVRLRNAHSLGFDRARIDAAAAARANGERAPFAVHVAEGIDAAAGREVHALDVLGLVDEHLLAVHAVGVDARGIGRLARRGSAVVWCATSNRFLFGRTCPRALLDHVGVLLGTDSLLTGYGTLLDELRVARALGMLSDARLESAVAATAAARFGLPAPSLRPEQSADLVVLRRPLLDATAADVALVIVAGRPRLADAQGWAQRIFDAAGEPAEAMTMRGVRKLVAAPLAAAARAVAVTARVSASTPQVGGAG